MVPQQQSDESARSYFEHGNGPKGNQKGKGRGKGKQQMQLEVTSSSVAESKQEFLKRMKDAVPEQAKIRMQTTLVESQRNVSAVPYQHLGAAGDVALAPRAELPAVVERVGFTGKPTAV